MPRCQIHFSPPKFLRYVNLGKLIRNFGLNTESDQPRKRNPSESERELPRVVNPAAGVSLKTTMHNPETLRVFALIDWM